jgi:prepilin peptidase CpaA
MLTYPLLIVFPAAMAFAAAYDLFTMKIPNKISIALLVAFLITAAVSGVPLQTTAIHIATAAVVLGAGFFAFLRGWVGGGDAKLLAAASLWFGFDGLLNFFVTVALLGGVLCMGILSYRRMVPDGYVTAPDWLVKLHQKDSGVPYGLAIGGAALLLYPDTLWFNALAS